MKDYRIDLRVRNARIVARMEARGWNNADLAREARVSQQEVGCLINFKRAPLLCNGRVRSSAMRICLALGASVEELWPEKHLETPMARNRAHVDVDSQDLAALRGDPGDDFEAMIERKDMVRRALAAMTPRERRVIEARFGLDGRGVATLEEVAATAGCTRERIRQIEVKGIRKAAARLKVLEGIDRSRERTVQINARAAL